MGGWATQRSKVAVCLESNLDSCNSKLVLLPFNHVSFLTKQIVIIPLIIYETGL